MSATNDIPWGVTRTETPVVQGGTYDSAVEDIEYDRQWGWAVFVKDYGVATGYSWQATVTAIDTLAPLWLDGSVFG